MAMDNLTKIFITSEFTLVKVDFTLVKVDFTIVKFDFTPDGKKLCQVIHCHSEIC